jgi:hypothetical protein
LATVTIVSRPAAAIALSAVAGLLLAGCSSGPAQPGSAVIIGSNVVTDDQIQHELTDIMSQSKVKQDQKSGTLDNDTRALVTNHVLQDLDARAAHDADISVPDQQVDQIVSSNGGVGKIADALSVDPALTKNAVHDLLLRVAFTKKYTDTLTVTFDFVTAKDRNDAIATANKIAADHNAIATMLKGGAQGQAGYQFALATYLNSISQTIQSQGQVPSATSAAAVFGAHPGSVIALQLPAQQGTQWVVALIRDRKIAPTPSGSTSSATGLPPSVLASIGASLVAWDVQNVSVKVSPRYGVWDQVGMSVVQNEGQEAGLVINGRA